MASAIRKPLKKNGRHRSREPRFRQNDEDSASCLGSLNGGVLLVAVRGRNARRAGKLQEDELQKDCVVRGATPTFVETVFAISGVVNSTGFGGAFDRCP